MGRHAGHNRWLLSLVCFEGRQTGGRIMGLLALIPLKDWVYGGLIVTLLIFGVYEKHHLIAEGQQHELAALKLSSDKLQKQTAMQTAELQAKATMAEQAYDKEVHSLSNLPPVSVRVCNSPSAHSGSVVPKAGAVIAGDAAPGTAPGDVLEVPPRDSGERDIGPMLSVLADRADQVSAELREYQTRQ